MPGALTRWDPFFDLADIRTRFDRLLGDLGYGGEREWTPAIDMIHGNLALRGDVPAIKPDKFTIEVDNGVLSLARRHEERAEKKDKHFVRRERRFGVLTATIPLPNEEARELITITPTAA